MIPYFGWDTVQVGSITIQVWGLFIALAFLAATWIAARRARAKGLSPDHVWNLAGWIFLASIVGSRAFHVIVYEPAYFAAHPWEALDPRMPGYAIMGGFLGAVVAFTWYVRRLAISWIAYADTLIWGLPWGCGIGRIGCFLIHDHPGTLSNGLLAVRYPDGQSRHDLGLYLSLVGFATGLLFLWLNRKPRAPGFWFGTFLIIEGLSRFVLDWLRIADQRYWVLTPAQWLGIVFIGIGVWIVRTRSAK